MGRDLSSETAVGFYQGFREDARFLRAGISSAAATVLDEEPWGSTSLQRSRLPPTMLPMTRRRLSVLLLEMLALQFTNTSFKKNFWFRDLCLARNLRLSWSTPSPWSQIISRQYSSRKSSLGRNVGSEIFNLARNLRLSWSTSSPWSQPISRHYSICKTFPTTSGGWRMSTTDPPTPQ